MPLHDLPTLTRDVVFLEPTVEDVGDTYRESFTDADYFLAVEFRLQVVRLHLSSGKLLRVVRICIHHFLTIERQLQEASVLGWSRWRQAARIGIRSVGFKGRGMTPRTVASLRSFRVWAKDKGILVRWQFSLFSRQGFVPDRLFIQVPATRCSLFVDWPKHPARPLWSLQNRKQRLHPKHVVDVCCCSPALRRVFQLNPDTHTPGFRNVATQW